MAFIKITHYVVQGRNGPGSISVPGVLVGDVLGLIFFNDFGFILDSHGPFQRVVTMNDQIQQVVPDDLSIVLPFNVYILN